MDAAPLVLSRKIELVVWYYYYLRVAPLVILSRFRSFPTSISVRNGPFLGFRLVFVQRTDRPTDGPPHGRTNGQTDKPSYRDARKPLKRREKKKIEN